MAEQQHDHGHGRAAATADEPLQVGILTASDRGARGERADVSGPTIHNLVADRLGGKVAQYKVVPDDRTAIETTLVEWADERRLDLIFTTGGTGFSPRDVTPDATKAVVERETPALVQAMLFESLRITPYAMLTRATAGIRKRTLIVNLPGNPKAVGENFEAIAEVLPHAVDIIRGVDTHANRAGSGTHSGHSEHAGNAAGNQATDPAQSRHETHAGGHTGHRVHEGHEAHAAPAAVAVTTVTPAAGIAKNVGGPPC
jgi:molybdenum cofactor synthesis domain-containing protein